MTVAAPVSEVLPTSFTGRWSVPVKYPVSARMQAASTMPISTAAAAITRGLRSAVSPVRPTRSSHSPGR
jgi:hypothetical protein